MFWATAYKNDKKVRDIEGGGGGSFKSQLFCVTSFMEDPHLGTSFNSTHEKNPVLNLTFNPISISKKKSF